jgi:hypothetical protein
MADNNFKESVKKSNTFFGVNPRAAAMQERMKILKEGLANSWQKTSLKRAALIATAVVVPTIPFYTMNSIQTNHNIREANAALQSVNAEKKKTVEDVANRHEMQERRKVDSAYTAAIDATEAKRLDQLNSTTTSEMELDDAYYDLRINGEHELVKVDYYLAKEWGGVLVQICELRKFIDKDQNVELDRILASVINGPKREELIKEAGEQQIAQFVENLCLGNKDESHRLIHYLGRAEYNEIRKFLINLRPEQAKKLKKAVDEESAIASKAAAEQKAKDKADNGKYGGGITSAIFSLLFSCITIGAVKDTDSKANPIKPAAIAGTICGAVVMLPAAALSGSFWGFIALPVGAAVGLVTGLARYGIDKLDN